MLPQLVDLRPVRKATLSICQSSFNGNIEKLCLHNNTNTKTTARKIFLNRISDLTSKPQPERSPGEVFIPISPETVRMTLRNSWLDITGGAAVGKVEQFFLEE